MDSRTQDRLAKVNEVSDVLKKCNQLIRKLADKFQWDPDDMGKEANDDRVQCPYNKHHLIRSCDLERHKQKCYLKSSSIPIYQSSSGFYDNANSVISLTSDDQDCSKAIIPAELHPYMFSVEERLQQYNDDLKMSRSKRKADAEKVVSDLSELTRLDDKPETLPEDKKSELEILAEQRDYKRRRQSYRAKNVHITKRSPLEITREIINNRMQELESTIKDSRERK